MAVTANKGALGISEVPIAKPKFLTVVSARLVAHAETAFMQVVELQDLDKVHIFIDAGINVNMRRTLKSRVQKCPLDAAVACGNMPIIEVLLRNEAIVTTYAVNKSLQINRTDITTVLLENGGEFDLRGYSILCCALKSHHMDAVRFMIRHGLGVDEPGDLNGLTPLHLLAKFDLVELGIEFIGFCPDVDVVDSLGHTPLYYASNKSSMHMMKRNLPLIQALITAGANPDRICDPSRKYKTPRQKLDASCLAKDVVYCTEQ